MFDNKVLPQNLEAEAALLSCLINDSKAYAEIPFINEDMFYNVQHRQIFMAIKKLLKENSPIDLLTVYQAAPNDEVRHRVNDVSDIVLSADHILHYAKLVKEAYLRRNNIRVLWKGLSALYNNQDETAGSIVSMIQTNLINNTEDGSATINIAEAIDDISNEIESVKTGNYKDETFTTGVYELDEIIRLKRGKCMYIGARPSHGKSILAKDIALANARRGDKILIVNLEMGYMEQMDRIMSSITGINYSKFENKKYLSDRDMSPIAEACERLSNYNLYFTKSFGLTPMKIKSIAVNTKAKHGLDMIIVDYLQLVSPDDKDKKNREQQVAEMSRSMKLLASELDVAVIVLTQLNRECEKRQGLDKMPNLSDSRESGSVENDADIILFSMIPDKYGIKKLDDDMEVNKNMILLRVAKNRQGETRLFIPAYFSGETVSIRSYRGTPF